jgi:hypothetical protein
MKLAKKMLFWWMLPGPDEAPREADVAIAILSPLRLTKIDVERRAAV